MRKSEINKFEKVLNNHNMYLSSIEDDYLEIGIDLPYEAETFVTVKNGENFEDTVSEFNKLYEDYDIDYETYLCLDNTGHGTNGAPYHIQDILNHYKKIEQELCNVAKELESMLN